jgi:hypothetical protein
VAIFHRPAPPSPHPTKAAEVDVELSAVNIKPVLQTWGRTLIGRVPTLSLEITKECPLRCPGCYAYEDAHLGTTNLRSL